MVVLGTSGVRRERDDRPGAGSKSLMGKRKRRMKRLRPRGRRGGLPGMGVKRRTRSEISGFRSGDPDDAREGSGVMAGLIMRRAVPERGQKHTRCEVSIARGEGKSLKNCPLAVEVGIGVVNSLYAGEEPASEGVAREITIREGRSTGDSTPRNRRSAARSRQKCRERCRWSNRRDRRSNHRTVASRTGGPHRRRR